MLSQMPYFNIFSSINIADVIHQRQHSLNWCVTPINIQTTQLLFNFC
jgi:hypothetical protein